MKATRPARALGWLVDIADRFWGPLGVVIVAALEVFVFVPRGMDLAMLIGAAIGAGILVGWLIGGEM